MFILVWLTFKILILLVIQKVQLWKVIFSHSRMPTFLWLYLHFFTGQFHLMSLKVAGDFATERFPPLGPSSWLIWQVWVNILASQSISNIYQHHHSQAHVCQLIILICHMLFWRRIFFWIVPCIIKRYESLWHVLPRWRPNLCPYKLNLWVAHCLGLSVIVCLLLRKESEWERQAVQVKTRWCGG